MGYLQGEELERYLKEWEAQQVKNEAWLKSRGWIETKKGDSSTWTHPIHGDKTYSWANVVDTAEMDLVHEIWTTVSQRTAVPVYDGCDGDYSNLQYEEEKDGLGHRVGKPVIWARYVHPVSGKVYSYLEAAEIARYYHNSEEEWLADGNVPCGWSRQVQALVGDTKLNAGDVLWLRFGPRNAPSDMDNVYGLDRIERKES